MEQEPTSSYCQGPSTVPNRQTTSLTPWLSALTQRSPTPNWPAAFSRNSWATKKKKTMKQSILFYFLRTTHSADLVEKLCEKQWTIANLRNKCDPKLKRETPGRCPLFFFFKRHADLWLFGRRNSLVVLEHFCEPRRDEQIHRPAQKRSSFGIHFHLFRFHLADEILGDGGHCWLKKKETFFCCQNANRLVKFQQKYFLPKIPLFLFFFLVNEKKYWIIDMIRR